MRGLIIRDPWIDLILAGRKTWEIRGKPTRFREPIALIRAGSGTVVGTATLADCLGPMSFEELRRHRRKHKVPESALREFVQQKYGDRAFGWVLTSVVRFNKPLPYDHPSGAVTWVRLPNDLSCE